ncbi:L-asparaginase [Arthrobotrys entomopaga]|nr:L-asparaginase [Arthrobotrys entomopaga]
MVTANSKMRRESFVEYEEAGAESRVLIIMTGGTICMKRSPDGYIPAEGFLDTCLAIRPSFNDMSPSKELTARTDTGEELVLKSLRTPLTSYHKRIRYCVMEFNPLLDSSSINAKGWKKIAWTIYNNYKEFDAFLVLHGTDSLAYTSSALSFMLHNLGKPVILTATKVNATAFAAFQSPNCPPLATVGINTTARWDLITRPNAIERFCVEENLDAHVACLRIFPGIMPEMVEGVLSLKNLKGLVLETFGAGNLPEDARLISVLGEACRRGIIIVNVTQCLTGTVSPLYAPGTALGRAGVVFGHDLTSEAALTKLIWLLGKNLTDQQIRFQMSHSLRGELTEQSQTLFEHPGLTPKMESLSRLGYAIRDGDLEEIERVLAAQREWLLNEVDYAGRTPLHHAAMQGNSKVLRHLLSRGASVHIRNRENHTPLYVAADAGYPENVKLLREAGAHLHPDEVELAQMLKQKAIRSSTSSMSNSPVGGSSSNHVTGGGGGGHNYNYNNNNNNYINGGNDNANSNAGGATLKVPEYQGAGGIIVEGNAGGVSRSVSAGIPTIGIDTEAADCWSLAGV